MKSPQYVLFFLVSGFWHMPIDFYCMGSLTLVFLPLLFERNRSNMETVSLSWDLNRESFF
jgi:hypothetical protein